MGEALGRTRYYATIGAVRHLQSNLQSSLAAIDIDEVVRERVLFDYHRNLTRLAEWADASGLVEEIISASARFIISADFPPKAAASFFIDTSLSEGTMTHTGLPSTRAIRVFSMRPGSSPKASAA